MPPFFLQKTLVPHLKTTRQGPDYIEDYRQDYGYLGSALHAGVLKARQQPQGTGQTRVQSASLITPGKLKKFMKSSKIKITD